MGTVYVFDKKNYCEEHYRAKCDKCPKCDEQITGHMVRTNNAAFHPGKTHYDIRLFLDYLESCCLSQRHESNLDKSLNFGTSKL